MDPAAASPLTKAPPASQRAELGALVRLAGPLVGANLLQMGIAAVDVLFIAQLGPRDLAAATLAAFLFNWLSYALIGLTSAAAPLIAAELGRRSHAVREVRRSFRMALWVGVAGSILVAFVLSRGEALFLLFRQDAVVARGAGHFLLILIPAVPLTVAAGVMRSVAAALGRPGWTFLITALALMLDVVANWMFVLGHLGAPAMGLAGSAVANLLSFGAMTAAYVVILHRDGRLRRYRLLGRWWRLDLRRAREIVRLGLPIMVIWMLEGGLFGGAAVLMGLIGVTEVAAHAIALSIAAFAFQVPFGIAQAATIRVGLAFGAGDRLWIARAGNVALMLGISVMAATALLIWAEPNLLIAIYIAPDRTANGQVVALARRLLMVAAVFQLADGAQVVAAGVLRGLQDTRVPMVIALIGYWVVGFGCSVVLGFATPLKGVGVWWGLAAGLLVVAILLVARWAARVRLGLLPAINQLP